MKPVTPAFVTLAMFVLCVAAQAADLTIEVSIDPGQNRKPISPHIYGTNQDLTGAAFTSRRLGGNRLTGYNWENNASNAGEDWFHSSDNFLTWNAGIPPSQESIPGIVLTDFHDQSLSVGADSIITLQMAGFVSADKNGTVAENETAPSSRWLPVFVDKPGALSLDPDLNDGAVYLDEIVNFLIDRYGDASSDTGVRAYSLDNEPALWAFTHPRIFPDPLPAAELVDRSIEVARMIKDLDPGAEVFGPALYGSNAYFTFQEAPDWNTINAGGAYDWFVDYYLEQMKEASNAAGVRLLDVLDVHRYAEHEAGGQPVTVEDGTNVDTNKGRMQSPRVLWDPTWTENSWVGQWFNQFTPYIPRFQESIDTRFPGTKLAFTEYNFGGGGHVSGGIAQADVLGIFGRFGVYAANYWQLHDSPVYDAAAFNLYRDYDGEGGTFGDTSVSAVNSDIVNASVYAAVNAVDDNRLHVIVLNKNYDGSTTVNFSIAGAKNYASGRVFAFDANSPAIAERAPISAISSNAFSYTLPPLTAAHIVLATDAVPPSITQSPAAQEIDIGAELSLSVAADGDGTMSYQWYRNGAAIVGATGAVYQVSSAQASHAGTYFVEVSNAAGSMKSDTVTVVVGPLSGRLSSLSTRGSSLAGDAIMIAGFNISGTAPRTVLIRGVGPGLVPLGIGPGEVLADPRITLYRGNQAIMGNNDWSDQSGGSDVAPVAGAVGAFGIEPGSADAGLVATLDPGLYSVHVAGADNGSGVAIVEVYDTEGNAGDSRLTSISTRGFVGTGNAIIIPGIAVGDGGRRVLIRGVGPGLIDLGVSDALPDPVIQVMDGAGNEVANNDNWGSAASSPEVAAAAQQVFAFSLDDGSNDASLLITLPPGVFTVLVSDKGGQSGIALVEVYQMP